MARDTKKSAGKKRRRLPWWGASLAAICMLAILWHQNHWNQQSALTEKAPASTNWIQGYQAALMHQQQLKKEWIVSHVHCGDQWNAEYYKKNLGNYKVLDSKGRGHNLSCYFPEADMTFIIDAKKQEVVTWIAGHNFQ